LGAGYFRLPDILIKPTPALETDEMKTRANANKARAETAGPRTAARFVFEPDLSLVKGHSESTAAWMWLTASQICRIAQNNSSSTLQGTLDIVTEGYAGAGNRTQKGSRR